MDTWIICAPAALGLLAYLVHALVNAEDL